MTKKIKEILDEVLTGINPTKEDLNFIKDKTKKFLDVLKKNIKEEKIDAEIFVGGSFAKKTLIKKKLYDVDLFIRFEKKYEEKDFPVLMKKVLKNVKNLIIVHGSRDYYQIKFNDFFIIEIVPVVKIKNQKQAKNITDLSYLHVKYIDKKIKSKRILEEIKLAKSFCEAQGIYGAESYIKGFSGYSLELLVLYHKGFEKFLRAIVNSKSEKIIIDIEKHYNNKNSVLMDLNESKLESPIILIDPTFKTRNALAALSKESFEKFKQEAKKFLKNPSTKYFEIKKINLEKIKKDAKKKKFEFILLEAKTKKQEGDVAGSKLKKFYNHLAKEIEKYFEIKDKGFNYNNKKSARFFIVVKPKKEIVLEGPKKSDKKNAEKFKKKHKKVFLKNEKLFTKVRINFSLQKFIFHWKFKNKKKIIDMNVGGLRVV